MANLFTVANLIRKEAGYDNMTQKEAIELAKKRIVKSKETGPKFKIGETVKTVGGQDAKIICFTHQGMMLVQIISRLGSYNNRMIKYYMDGTSPFASDINGLKLIPNAA